MKRSTDNSNPPSIITFRTSNANSQCPLVLVAAAIVMATAVCVLGEHERLAGHVCVHHNTQHSYTMTK